MTAEELKNPSQEDKKEKKEITALEQADNFKKIESFETPENIKNGKDMLDIVKKDIEKNKKNIDWPKQNDPKLSTYIEANKIFKEYIKTQQDKYKTSWNTAPQIALQELQKITNEIQNSIDTKIITILTEDQKQSEKTKEEMVKNFSQIDDKKLEEYSESKKTYIDKIKAYEGSENTIIKDAYKKNTTGIDDIQKIIDLKNLDKKMIDKERLGELQQFIINTNFTWPEKALLRKSTWELLSTAPKWDNEKIREANTARDILNTNYTTQEEVKNGFFEKNKAWFDALMERIYWASTTPKEIWTTPEEIRLTELIKLYTGNNDIDNIKIGKGKDMWDQRFDQSNEWILQYKETEKPKEILQFTKESEDFTDKKINATGANKEIHTIIDMKDAPEKIKITREGSDIIATKTTTYTDTEHPKEITTYITDDKKLITVKENDTLEKIPTIPKTETKYIYRWANKDGQSITADKYIGEKTENGKTTYDISEFSDETFNKKGINAFDDKWNYVAFGRFMETKGVNYVTSNLNSIITQIKWYKPETETVDGKDNINTNELKDGYGNALTDYAINHPEMLSLYCGYLTPDNMNILWGSKETRIANFNKLANSKDFQTIIKTLPESQKQAIIDLRTSIAEEKKITLKEGLKSMGNILVNLMMMFWLGKWALKNRLPKSMQKDIDDIYAKEFALENDEKNAIEDITENLKKDKNPERVKEDWYKVPKAWELKDNNKLTSEEINVGNYKFIDPKILRKGMEIYNSKHQEKIKESDIIITKNKKEEINITNDNTDKIKEIITEIIESEETRKNIAEANNNIRKLSPKEKDNTPYSEYYTDPEERERSIIQSEKDIGTYVASYLFTGSKDMSYTITENNLIDGEALPKQKTNDKWEISPETAEQKFTKNRDLIAKDTKIDKTTKKYSAFNYANNFSYKTDATWDQKTYQENILTPLENIMKDKDQFIILKEKLKNKTDKTYESIFTDPNNIANMLVMIDTKENKTDNKDSITQLREKDTKITSVTTDNTDNITLTTTWTKNGTIRVYQATVDNKTSLKTERKEEKKTAK